MNFLDLQNQIGNYVYTEDFGMSAISIASIISTRLQLSDPVWLILIGPSSSGKSQILRPLALTDPKFLHRVDDLTENSLLSGSPAKKGEKDKSFLTNKIGKLGIIVISDFTVIFSKGSESKNAILSQFRMLYDGEMIKYVGTSSEPITWKGSVGVIAGSTPSIYGHFEEVADMGERFIYYRMKAYNIEKATRMSMDRKMYGKALDEKIAEFYEEYIRECVLYVKDHSEEIPPINPEVHERILQIAMFASVLRTPVHYDKFSKVIDRIPVSEMPMRVALQLRSLIIGGMCMEFHDSNGESWDISEQYIQYIEWCAYSLANEERRACLKVLGTIDYNETMRTQTIADKVGLSTSVIGIVLQHLAAVGIVDRSGMGDSLTWKIKERNVWSIVRRLEGIDTVSAEDERDITEEEVGNTNFDDMDF